MVAIAPCLERPPPAVPCRSNPWLPQPPWPPFVLSERGLWPRGWANPAEGGSVHLLELPVDSHHTCLQSGLGGTHCHDPVQRPRQAAPSRGFRLRPSSALHNVSNCCRCTDLAVPQANYQSRSTTFLHGLMKSYVVEAVHSLSLADAVSEQAQNWARQQSCPPPRTMTYSLWLCRSGTHWRLRSFNRNIGGGVAGLRWSGDPCQMQPSQLSSRSFLARPLPPAALFAARGIKFPLRTCCGTAWLRRITGWPRVLLGGTSRCP